MGPIDSFFDYLAIGVVVLGTLFALIAAIGVWRMPDVFARLHCTTKAGTLGSILVVAGLGLQTGDSAVWLRCALLLVFLALTGPVAGQAIAKAAWSAGHRPKTNDGDGEPQPVDKFEQQAA